MGEFEALEELLIHVTNRQSHKHSWKCNLDDEGVFSVKTLSHWIDEHQMDVKALWSATVWVTAYMIWKNRNNKVFTGRMDNCQSISGYSTEGIRVDL